MKRFVTLRLVALLLVSACGPRDAGRVQSHALTAALDVPAVLATIPEAPQESSPSELGMHQPDQAPPEYLFSERGGGVAWIVESREGFQVFHDGRPGKRYPAVGKVALSPDGKRCAYGALVGGGWRMVTDGVEGREFGTVRRPVFSRDGAHLAYQGMAGERWHLVVDGRVNGGTDTRYLEHAFSGDASRVLFVEAHDGGRLGKLWISDLGFERPVVAVPSVASMAVEGRRVAAVALEGAGRRVVTFDVAKPEEATAGPVFSQVDSLTFGAGGGSVAYVGERSGEYLVVLDGKEERLGAGAPVGPLTIRPDGGAVGVLMMDGRGVVLRQLFTQRAEPTRGYESAEGLSYSPDGRSYAFAASMGGKWFVVVNGEPGPAFDRVVTPAFSPDGRRVVFRARRAGERFVVVADAKGQTLREHSPYEQVFPVLFTADGKASAYGVKLGRQLLWKVEAL
jgi:hypothetical protein